MQEQSYYIDPYGIDDEPDEIREQEEQEAAYDNADSDREDQLNEEQNENEN